jgi:hypothetical protein
LRILLKPWLFLILLAVCIGAIVFGIYRYRHRLVRSDTDMVALLPSGDATVFFANVAALRQAGVLSLLAGSKTIEEPEYREFVRQTHFDYTRDIQAIAGAADGKQILFIIRGRFDWSRLRQYALTHGGACKNSFCDLPSSNTGRWNSFVPIQSDVMGLAVARDSTATLTLIARRDRVPQQIPPQPVWVRVSRSLLTNPISLPVPVRIFAISLQFANPVLLSLDSGVKSGSAFSLQLDAQCPNSATAEAIKAQLDLETRALRMELAREHQKPSPADFTGLLLGGTFQAANNRVIGTWPIHKELLNTLQ